MTDPASGSRRPNASAVPFSLLAALAFISVIPPLGVDTYLPAFPQMAADLAASPSAIQLTLTTFMLGMAVGQLVIGPVSDAVGRRRPLILSTLLCLAATAACAVAPSASVLIGARLVMGVAGGGATVLARAILTDLTSGAETARGLNLLQALGSIGPVIAPAMGGVLLLFTNWRGIFWFLAAAVVAMLAAAILRAPESLPRHRRSGADGRDQTRNAADGEGELHTPQASGEPAPVPPAQPARPRQHPARELLDGTRHIIGDRGFACYLVAAMCGSGALFSYIAGSSFVYQKQLGLSPGLYSVAFAVNSLGMTGMSLLASRQSRRWRIRSMLYAGLGMMSVFSAALVVLAVVGAPASVMIVGIFFAIIGQGLVFGNATALAMMRARTYAGTASALLGSTGFALGASVSPIVGLGDPTIMMTSLMCVFSLIGLAATRLARGVPQT